MRGTTLRVRIVRVLIVLLSAVIVSLSMTLSHLFATVLTSQRLDSLKTITEQDAKATKIDSGRVSFSGNAPGPGQSLIVVGREGRILYQAGKPLPPLDSGWLPGRNELLEGHAQTFKTSLSPLGEPVFVSGVSVGSPPLAALYLVEPAASGDEVIAKTNRVLLLAALGALLLAGGGALLVADRMAHPLVKMERMARRMIVGDYTGQVSVRGRDELASLGQSFNQLSAHLQRMHGSRAEFLTNVSHDLRTPVSYIRGYAQLLAEGLVSSPEEQHKYLIVIQEETTRLQLLLDDLVDLARFEELEPKIVVEQTDLAELVRKACGTLQLFAQQNKITLAYVEVDVLPLVLVDPRRIEQVLINLLHNAIRYSHENGEVRVQTRVSKTQVMVTVEDLGLGIAQTELPYVFERFYRVEKSRNREHGGTGVGLAIVKQIVELHGGQVRIDSEPGKGTSVSFYLPRMLSNEEEGRG